VTTKIKICGITLPDDAARAAAAGADFIGINFWPKSRRHVAASRAPLLAAASRAAGAALVVGVFVDPDPDDVAAIMQEVDLDLIQLHGEESPAAVTQIATISKRPVWKAVAATADAPLERWPADAILLDTPTPGKGGSGQAFDWSIARALRRRYPARSIVLAGGLTAANVAAAIADVEPWAVDVASGVEAAPGIKDPTKITGFIAAVRAC
jgi:phosphoribosylanthranilate isomerase